MIRFITNALPLLVLLLALFGFAVEVLDLEPRSGAVIRLAVFEQSRVPASVVLGAWVMEACGLLALFLLAQGRCGAWWLDGLVAGWLAWVFRGPLLVLTIVVAARQPQDPWWDIAFGWWILYSVCGLALAMLARRSGLVFATEEGEEDGAEPMVEQVEAGETAESGDLEASEPESAEEGVNDPDPVEPTAADDAEPAESEADAGDLESTATVAEEVEDSETDAPPEPTTGSETADEPGPGDVPKSTSEKPAD